MMANKVQGWGWAGTRQCCAQGFSSGSGGEAGKVGLQPFSFKAGRVELNRQEILAYCLFVPFQLM